ncbi:hypothetical protein EK21DRAFT_99605 [Setomelanomma holmii]|uniref:Gfd2/YDR514C-like C-terminal domain-containing protein n=1 Tax=Setomelanomma holmii TaxID=210430 RepID=A0A9P4LN52_9PLEO|nr:hypothetical protein EK21DRAFT_99605 [Setomelanomma holmii]
MPLLPPQPANIVSLEPQPLAEDSSKQEPLELPKRSAPVPPVENTDRRFVLVKGAASSYNPAAMRSSNPPPKPSPAPPAIDLQRGDLTAAHVHFTPIRALAKYPYTYCDRTRKQEIASAFFDGGKFWEREWDLYYVWDVEPVKPLIIVRESQFQALLTEINNHLKLNLAITNWQREESLVTRFPDHPDCRPRYLGRSSSRQQFDDMTYNTPTKGVCAAGESACGPPDSGTLEQFKELMEELWDVQRAKTKANKEKKQQERLGRQKTMQDQLKRAQRYLGLHPSEATGSMSTSGPLSAIDASLPAPFPQDQSVVFVCVDVESYERAHDKITEVGIATLDTSDIISVAPGTDGEAWRKHIKARHFRIKENCHLVNHEHVAGHPDGFEFGESTFVSLKEAPMHVAACFQPPFGMHTSNTPATEVTAILANMEVDKNGNLMTMEKRNIVFLGHDALSDVRYLQQLGYDPLRAENIIEAMDTATMYQAWQREMQAPSLGRILYHFDIVGWKLHNAGNDAIYTVQAMLALCVREATMRGSSELETKRNEDMATKMAAAQDAAAERIKEEAKGWSVVEAVADGGKPVPPKSP